MTEERAVLAGGCFWGVQDLIRRYDGVLSTRVGYTGGSVSHATYRNHGSHAEAVEVIFDPTRVSYRQILEFFFQIHDPSTRNRQGNDVGTSYRSAIFYTSNEQKRIAEDTIADVDASGLWPGKGYRSRSGRRLLGGRTGASGLSPTISRRLHLPFRPAPLETADRTDKVAKEA
jgi:peptide-methionine (S)-S-oxide reductase